MTQALLVVIGLLAVVGGWRIARWHWRPRLVLPADPILEPGQHAVRVFLDIRNEGAGRSRGCRARLVRWEKRESIGWIRLEPPRPGGRADLSPRRAVIAPGGSSRIELDRSLPPEAGTYRLEVAVLNGEERRASYVIEVEAV